MARVRSFGLRRLEHVRPRLRRRERRRRRRGDRTSGACRDQWRVVRNTSETNVAPLLENRSRRSSHRGRADAWIMRSRTYWCPISHMLPAGATLPHLPHGRYGGQPTVAIRDLTVLAPPTPCSPRPPAAHNGKAGIEAACLTRTLRGRSMLPTTTHSPEGASSGSGE